ncbi:MAG: hypothetical protein M1829_003560 [Trizodia sp. TS-e1964]|nr:MAG: hypothetical protein M1829_003560 [Trizodia sp. TS-e1964]
MGTRGYKIIRFRRRDFIYYNHWDSYPEGLGHYLLKQIPSEPEKYKQWLEKQRAIYADMTAALEAKVLTITEETLQAYGTDDQEFWMWKYLDDRLQELPSSMGNVGSNLWIEWTYTIDLDLELFTVDSWLHFNLSSVPEHSFVRVLNNDYDSRRHLYSPEMCPEAFATLPPVDYFAGGTTQAEYEAKYKEYKTSIVKAKGTVHKSAQLTHRHEFAVVLLENLVLAFALEFKNFVHKWRYDEFAFREMAFAIISFASGQVRFQEPALLEGDADDGYFIDFDDLGGGEGRRKLLPIFARGCHSAGKEAGSAPISSMYWFEDVLVSLVPETTLNDAPEAAIAKTVTFAMNEGRRNFHAVILSLANIILLQVESNADEILISHTETASLISLNEVRASTSSYQSDKVEYDDEYEDEDEEEDEGENVIIESSGPNPPSKPRKQKHSGFVSLLYFFDAAAKRIASPYGQGCFPTEIYSKIIQNTDALTRNTCAIVSPTFHALSRKLICLGEDWWAVPFSHALESHDSLKAFPFRNRHTGVTVLSETLETHKYYSWSPIIGVERSSIISQIQLNLPLPGGVKPWRPPRRKIKISDGYYKRWGGPDHIIDWNIPNHCTTNDVEETWGFYIKQYFCTEDFESRFFWEFEPSSYPCLFPPNYRQLKLMAKPIDKTLFLCIRRHIDGATLEQRAKTLEYIAVELYKEREAGGAHYGEIVMLVHGLEVSLYGIAGEDAKINGRWSLDHFFGPLDMRSKENREDFERMILTPIKEMWEAESSRKESLAKAKQSAETDAKAETKAEDGPPAIGS